MDESDNSNDAEYFTEEDNFKYIDSFEDSNELSFDDVSKLDNVRKKLMPAKKPAASTSPIVCSKRTRLPSKTLGMMLKKRKIGAKREYTDEQLEAAINDIKNGKPLPDTAAKYNIPRSTLYMRAKVLNIALTLAKSEYTFEDMTAAIDLVLGMFQEVNHFLV